MGDDFYRTKGGHEFYYGTMPQIARALEQIAKELKRANDAAAAEAERRGDGKDSRG